MLLAYLKKAIERVKKSPQSHLYNPQYCRSWELPDGQLVIADTYDETELDKTEVVKNPSFLDYYRSNKKPPVIGSLSSNTALTSSQFAQQFLDKFNQLSLLKDEHATENGSSIGAPENGAVEKPADPIA